MNPLHPEPPMSEKVTGGIKYAFNLLFLLVGGVAALAVATIAVKSVWRVFWWAWDRI